MPKAICKKCQVESAAINEKLSNLPICEKEASFSSKQYPTCARLDEGKPITL